MGLEWLKHAFATDPPGPATPTKEQERIVNRICQEVVRRQLVTPAQMALEMGRPLNYMSAQLLHYFQPFATVLADAAAYEQFTSFLEQRGSVDYISARLDALEAESHAHEPTSRSQAPRDSGPPKDTRDVT